jgi:hypothetical protein
MNKIIKSFLVAATLAGGLYTAYQQLSKEDQKVVDWFMSKMNAPKEEVEIGTAILGGATALAAYAGKDIVAKTTASTLEFFSGSLGSFAASIGEFSQSLIKNSLGSSHFSGSY